MKLPRPQYLLAAGIILLIQFLTVNYFSPLNNEAAPNWAINMTWGSTQYLFDFSLAGFWIGLCLLILAAWMWEKGHAGHNDIHKKIKKAKK